MSRLKHTVHMFKWEDGELKKVIREGLTYQDAIKVATLSPHNGARIYNDSGFLVHEVQDATGAPAVDTYA